MDKNLRAKENLHVIFWLVKVFAWLLDFKILGISMAFPTIILSCWLTWKMRGNRSELFHNMAITSWICANSIWMFGEFYFEDGIRHIAFPFFLIGFSIIVWYYIGLLFKPKSNS
jgi:hypothetical protein